MTIDQSKFIYCVNLCNFFSFISRGRPVCSISNDNLRIKLDSSLSDAECLTELNYLFHYTKRKFENEYKKIEFDKRKIKRDENIKCYELPLSYDTLECLESRVVSYLLSKAFYDVTGKTIGLGRILSFFYDALPQFEEYYKSKFVSGIAIDEDEQAVEYKLFLLRNLKLDLCDYWQEDKLSLFIKPLDSSREVQEKIYDYCIRAVTDHRAGQGFKNFVLSFCEIVKQRYGVGLKEIICTGHYGEPSKSKLMILDCDYNSQEFKRFINNFTLGDRRLVKDYSRQLGEKGPIYAIDLTEPGVLFALVDYMAKNIVHSKDERFYFPETDYARDRRLAAEKEKLKPQVPERSSSFRGGAVARDPSPAEGSTLGDFSQHRGIQRTSSSSSTSSHSTSGSCSPYLSRKNSQKFSSSKTKMPNLQPLSFSFQNMPLAPSREVSPATSAESSPIDMVSF
uniref:hypothetical protein n=1 Tax=Wolbachia endosymbiont of Pentidionis agamae TaxID=3110435 RepID=UPI002FD4A950